jgi:ribose 5-phosphate isomerase B
MAIRRLAFIGEAEARQIERGATVELEAHGHVTPLARETLAERRVTVVAAGSVDPAIPPDIGPAWPIARVAIGADHAGVALKAALVAHLRRQAVAVVDCGTDGAAPVDYPDTAAAVARLVARREVDAGVVIDGAGLGSAIAANKVRGVRAAMCATPTLARYAREHNGANVLALGATILSAADAIEILDVWRATATREPRYLRRLVKIARLEERT